MTSYMHATKHLILFHFLDRKHSDTIQIQYVMLKQQYIFHV